MLYIQRLSEMPAENTKSMSVWKSVENIGAIQFLTHFAIIKLIWMSLNIITAPSPPWSALFLRL